jgi:hypothetical protein
MSRVATVGQLAVARDRREEQALVPDRRGLADRVVHERGVGERPECDSAGGDQVVHRERAGDVAGPAGPGRAPAECGYCDDAPDAVRLGGLGGGSREADEGGFNRSGLRVRRRQPEDGVGARECLVHDCGVPVRALDDVEALADAGRELSRIADDDPELFTAAKQVAEDLAADLAGGRGDDDHGTLLNLILLLACPRTHATAVQNEPICIPVAA